MATVFTDAGKQWTARKLEGTETGSQDKIAWGTGAGTAAVTDTTLFTESTEARVVGTMSVVTTDVANDTYQVVGTITALGSKTITNAGVFDSTDGGDMLMKGDFSGVPVLASDSIEFTFKLKFDD